MNQKRAKNPMLLRAKLTRTSLDFWANPPKRIDSQFFYLVKHSKHLLIFISSLTIDLAIYRKKATSVFISYEWPLFYLFAVPHWVNPALSFRNPSLFCPQCFTFAPYLRKFFFT
jgi:hypothetical protein